MDKLTDFQLCVVKECIKKKSGCLSVPMGAGKTLMALALSKTLDGPSCNLVVCSKTLIQSWVNEITKFFDDSMSWQIVTTKSNTTSIYADIVLTTPETLSKYYSNFELENLFVQHVIEYRRNGNFDVLVKHYNIPKRPLLNKINIAGNFFYSSKFRFVFIDEIQCFNNIESIRCRAIACICSNHTWALSGTPIVEPKIERILGYYLMIKDFTFPNNIPAAEEYLENINFKGLASTMVIRTMKDVDFSLPSISDFIIEHDLSEEETLLYNVLRNITKELRKHAVNFALMNNVEMNRKFNSYLLGMITMVRQFLICPLVPITSMLIDAMGIESRDEMTAVANINELTRLQLLDYLNNPDSVKSSRIINILNVVDNHLDERIIIFSCFRTSIDVIKHYVMETGRPVFNIESKHSAIKRNQIVSEFQSSDGGILLLTYGLGAEGLNIQAANVVLLSDVWWNCGKTKQAIARVARRGQTKHVFIYFFTSNTGIEKALFGKLKGKQNVIEEITTGSLKSIIPTLKIAEILNLLTDDGSTQNATLLRDTM
jgi:SNF2 family DNA or RNA helicase